MPANNFYQYKAKQNTRLEKCEPNSDLILKKMKELRFNTLLVHMLQTISDSLFSSILIDLFPANF